MEIGKESHTLFNRHKKCFKKYEKSYNCNYYYTEWNGFPHVEHFLLSKVRGLSLSVVLVTLFAPYTAIYKHTFISKGI